MIDLCTQRVLVMERLIGMRLEDFVRQGSPEAKQRAGDLLTTAFHEMAYVFPRVCTQIRTVENFLFALDGSLSLIDFGCVKYFDDQFLINYGLMGNHIIDGKREDCDCHGAKT